MSGVQEEFSPLRPEKRRNIVRLVLLAPVLWVAALIVAAVVLRETQAIELGLLIATVSLVGALVLLLPTRWLRIREEGKPAPPG